MLSLTIGAFERMQTQFSFFDSEAWRVDFLVGFAAPTEFIIVL